MNEREAPEPHDASDDGGTGGWIAPLLAAGFTVGWCLLIFWLIGDRPTVWQYGVTPYVPSQSLLTTASPRAGQPPAQIVFPKVKGKPTRVIR